MALCFYQYFENESICRENILGKKNLKMVFKRKRGSYWQYWCMVLEYEKFIYEKSAKSVFLKWLQCLECQVPKYLMCPSASIVEIIIAQVFKCLNPAGTRHPGDIPEGLLKVLMSRTYKGPSGDFQGTNTKTDDSMLSCEICEFFKNTFFYRTHPVAVSGNIS